MYKIFEQILKMKYAKKSLGQNFLIDKNIINKIINLTKVENKNIMEIGPGKGALTNEILNRKPKSLLLIEKDKILSEELKYKYLNFPSVKILNKDILKYDIEKNLLSDTIVFGNLPYNISSQILVKFLKFKKWPPKFKNLIFMFQKELGEKIIGKFKTKDYGRLSILTNYKLKYKEKFFVSAGSFFPRPKISSVVINFIPKGGLSYDEKNIEKLEKLTNILFSNRRKMINKNILKIFEQHEIKKLKYLDTKLRPEEIKPEVYYELLKLIKN